MSVERCPNCNKIISPNERLCSNCGEKLDNPYTDRINSIYHTSNIATLWFFVFFAMWAVIFIFSNWIVATAITAVVVALFVYYKFKK